VGPIVVWESVDQDHVWIKITIFGRGQYSSEEGAARNDHVEIGI
jgi:hypothetical protein